MVADSRLGRRFRPASSVHARVFDEELVILDLARGEYLALDAIGTRLWRGMEAGLSVDDIAADVAAEYDVTLERATSDLEALAAEFLDRGLFVELKEPE